MSLTKAQKDLLDSILESHIKTCYNNKDNFMLSEFRPFIEKAKLPYNGNSVLQSIKRINNKLGYKDMYMIDRVTSTYSYVPVIWINGNTKIKKEKNILYFFCCENNESITYDFLTQKFSVDLSDHRTWKTSSWGTPYIIFHYNSLCEALKYEWMWNYTDDFSSLINIIEYSLKEECFSKMPKDILRIKGDDENLNSTHVMIAYFSEKYGTKYGKFIYYLYNTMYKSTFFQFEKLLDSVINISAFMKMVINSIYTTPLSDICRHIRSIVERYYEAIDIYKIYNISPESIIFDTNRDIETNCGNINSLIDSVQSKALEEKLQKLNFINNLVINDYIVIVPQTQADKIDEGKQQNNCVGHYYDDSIINGENLIYFLRKKNNPKKSLVTCRYSIECKRTVEYRSKNNDAVSLEQERVIKQIDVLINAEFKKQNK